MFDSRIEQASCVLPPIRWTSFLHTFLSLSRTLAAGCLVLKWGAPWWPQHHVTQAPLS